MGEIKSVTVLEDLAVAYEGSYYTISGCGGDLSEWTQGYEDLLAKEGIGRPVQWLQTTGAAINLFAGQTHDPYPLDTVVLMFPLTGLNPHTLPIFKIRMEDRWFRDIIDNMRDQR